MKLLESKFFKNICKGLGLGMLAVSVLIILAITCYDVIIKIYIHYGAISEAITSTLILYGVVWLICKLFGLNFKNFLC